MLEAAAVTGKPTSSGYFDCSRTSHQRRDTRAWTRRTHIWRRQWSDTTEITTRRTDARRLRNRRQRPGNRSRRTGAGVRTGRVTGG
ncbi:hypothetical protein C9J85_12575 [Haloferax sp. wsp5]|nr:hypothetical protein C9J85_12575 [Haloferax sp. wsp5]